MTVAEKQERPAARRAFLGWRRPLVDRPAAFWLLAVPPLAWLSLLFIVPLLLAALFSFRPDMRGPLLGAWTPSLRHYASLLATGSYWRLLGVSAVTALVTAAGATLLAYPVAYFIAFRAGRRAGLYLLLLLVPFWTSYLLRVMAWKFLLGSEGVLNSLLRYAGLTEAPVTLLLYNRPAVVITLIYVWIPFVALPILAALQRIDPALFEAAADLGAAPWRTLVRITLPLSLPGLLAGFFMVFIPTLGEYVTPLLVGGTRGIMYGNIVQDFFTKAGNWPFGSAMAMVMLASTLLLVTVALRLVDVRRLLD
jgi:spermidine/putrescine transport system permease protein